MNWKTFLKPSLEKFVLLLILFTFFPWPNQYYAGGHQFGTSYLFTGPILVAKILSIVFGLGTVAPSYGRLLSENTFHSYGILAVIVIVSYILSCLVSHYTRVFAATKTKSAISFSLLAVSAVILFVSVKGVFFDHPYNENAMTFNSVIPLLIFGIFYLAYSFIAALTRRVSDLIKRRRNGLN